MSKIERLKRNNHIVTYPELVNKIDEIIDYLNMDSPAQVGFEGFPYDNVIIHGNNDAYRLGYKKAIDKACEWLNDVLRNGCFVTNDTGEREIKVIIDDFHKYMEE